MKRKVKDFMSSIQNRRLKIILSGGGTIGAVSPLLAIKEKLIEKKIPAEFIWVGTVNGIEKDIIAREKIEYCAIQSGKFRRYFSFQNFIDPFRFIAGFFQSLGIIKKFQPDLILSAGGFVSVPLAMAAKLRGKTVIIHQQDIKVGLANRIMSWFAKIVTVTFKTSLKDFAKEKTMLLGNPCRSKIFEGKKAKAKDLYDLANGRPVVLVIGGSLGAEWINNQIFNAVEKLTEKYQIIHSVGKGHVKRELLMIPYYHQVEYLHDIENAYAAADLVVARAGLSTLTELAALGKPAIIIPIPDNQQEANAYYLKNNNAAIIVEQGGTDDLVAAILKLLEHPKSLEVLAKNIKDLLPADAADKYVDFILKVSNFKNK